MATTTGWTASEEAEITRIMETTSCNRKAAIRKIRSAAKATKTTEPATSELVPRLAELLEVILPVAAKFKSHYGETKKLIGENKQQLLALFEMFGVSQGNSGKKLNIENNRITRDEFIDTYFGCSVKYMKAELGIKTPKGDSKKKKPQDTENYKLGYSDGKLSVTDTEEIQSSIKDGVNKRYERQIFDHQKMLAKLLDEIETVGDRLPLILSELAKKMRADLKAKNVIAETEKAIENADLTPVKDVIAKLDACDDDEEEEQADAAQAGL